MGNLVLGQILRKPDRKRQNAAPTSSAMYALKGYHSLFVLSRQSIFSLHDNDLEATSHVHSEAMLFPRVYIWEKSSFKLSHS